MQQIASIGLIVGDEHAQAGELRGAGKRRRCPSRLGGPYATARGNRQRQSNREHRTAIQALAGGLNLTAVQLDDVPTIDRPRPTPLLRRVGPLLACLKRSKTCGSKSAAMPQPLSATVIATVPTAVRGRTRSRAKVRTSRAG